MTKIKDTATALYLFEEAAAKHAEANENGDYKTGNKCYATIVKAMTFLKDHEDVLALIKFLSHPSVGVRMWAATYLLPIKENDGIKVLEKIEKENNIHSFVAKTTLSEWRKGTLKL
jgi:hypothetical protein